MKFAFAIVCAIVGTTAAHAGGGRWTADVESDPFTKGTKVSLDYSAADNSGVAILCDTTQQGIAEIRAVPGYAYAPILKGKSPRVAVAVDGNILFELSGYTGSVGDNLAAVGGFMTAEQAREFAEAFTAAKKQIAIKDGISDRPYLLTTAGSTASGKALLSCLDDAKKSEAR